MTNELKKSILLGSLLGLVFLLASNLEQTTAVLVSLIACIIFGPLTVWLINNKPNIYALIICLVSGLFLFSIYGLKYGAVYVASVAFVYGILAVQFSMALANSYDNILYLISKFKNRK